MRAAPSPPPRDLDFDGPRGRALAGPTEDVVAYFQRLVVNPFLGVAVASGCVAAGLWAEDRFKVEGATLGSVICGLAAGWHYLRFHCIDCGATESYYAWKRHSCRRVRDRWSTSFAFWRSHYPTPGTQLVLWVLGLSLVEILIATHLRR